MDPTDTSNPPTESDREPAADAEARQKQKQKKALDQEIDRELDDTFPASDPLPWNHKVD